MNFRTKNDLSRRVVGELVGCSQSTIKCIECEENAPSYALEKALLRLMAMPEHAVRRLIAAKGIRA